MRVAAYDRTPRTVGLLGARRFPDILFASRTYPATRPHQCDLTGKRAKENPDGFACCR